MRARTHSCANGSAANGCAGATHQRARSDQRACADERARANDCARSDHRASGNERANFRADRSHNEYGCVGRCR